MKHLFRLLFGGLMAGAMASSSFGVTYVFTDTDPDSGIGPLKFLTAGTSSSTYSSSFSILNVPGVPIGGGANLPGYDPNTMVITSAKVYFAFADDGDKPNSNGYESSSNQEKVSVSLQISDTANVYSTLTGGGVNWASFEVDGTHDSVPGSYDWYQTELSAQFLQFLQDGVIKYKVTAVSGDTYLKVAKLEATFAPRVSTREDGATFALLGLSVTGLAALRRRFRSAVRR